MLSGAGCRDRATTELTGKELLEFEKRAWRNAIDHALIDLFWEELMPKTKSKKQVGYLLSKGSPLTGEQRERLMTELHTGKVKVKKKKKQ
jgi:hypothetical protein